MQTISAVKALALGALLSAAFLPAPSWAKAVATLKPEATVKGPSIRLGDIASIKGSGPGAVALANLELGPSPLPGNARIIGADAVRIRLRQGKLDPATLAPGPVLVCRVTRAYQTISSDRLIEAARAHLQEGIEPGEGKPVIEPMTRPRDLTLPVGEVELAVEAIGTPASGASRQVAVQVRVDGERFSRVTLALRIRRYVRVAVAASAIPRGEAVTSDRIGYEERDKGTLPPDVILEGESLDDLQAAQAIPAGAPLTRRLVAQPAAIHRGDTLTLQARIGGIVISTPGTAMEDGRVGQWIRVRNESSKQDARAQVIDEKTVEVKL